MSGDSDAIDSLRTSGAGTGVETEVDGGSPAVRVVKRTTNQILLDLRRTFTEDYASSEEEEAPSVAMKDKEEEETEGAGVMEELEEVHEVFVNDDANPMRSPVMKHHRFESSHEGIQRHLSSLAGEEENVDEEIVFYMQNLMKK